MQRFKNAYSIVAVQWLLACVLFAGVTIISSLYYSVRDKQIERIYAGAFNRPALTTLSGADATEFLTLTRERGETSMNQPWVGFSEVPFHSARLNIDAARPLPLRRALPPRRTNRPTITVWLLGGSTAWGYGVPDDQTIAAHLQRVLQERLPDRDVQVINHAHCGYYSSQEIVLLQWLLRSGHRADAAVFLDGFNDARYWHDDLAEAFGEPQKGRLDEPMMSISGSFAPIRLARSIVRHLGVGAAQNEWPPKGRNEIPQRAEAAFRRYLENMRLGRTIGSEFGVRTLFAWQPTPFDYIEARPDDPAVKRVFAVWARNPVVKPLNALVRAGIHDDDFAFVADALQGQPYQSSYLDSCHYGDAAGRRVAEAIAAALLQRGRTALARHPTQQLQPKPTPAPIANVAARQLVPALLAPDARRKTAAGGGIPTAGHHRRRLRGVVALAAEWVREERHGAACHRFEVAPAPGDLFSLCALRQGAEPRVRPSVRSDLEALPPGDRAHFLRRHRPVRRTRHGGTDAHRVELAAAIRIRKIAQPLPRALKGAGLGDEQLQLVPPELASGRDGRGRDEECRRHGVPFQQGKRRGDVVRIAIVERYRRQPARAVPPFEAFDDFAQRHDAGETAKDSKLLLEMARRDGQAPAVVVEQRHTVVEKDERGPAERRRAGDHRAAAFRARTVISIG